MTEFKKRTQKTRLFCSVAHFSVKSNGDPNYNSERAQTERCPISDPTFFGF